MSHYMSNIHIHTYIYIYIHNIHICEYTNISYIQVLYIQGCIVLDHWTDGFEASKECLALNDSAIYYPAAGRVVTLDRCFST